MQKYIVRAGDTLSRIAERRLGQANRWPEIAALNHLQNPNLIFVGQELTLPDVWPAAAALTRQRPIGLMSGNVAEVQIPANVALARGFLFVVFEQLPDVGAGKIVRKVAAIPRDFSLRPANSLGSLNPAEHVLNLKPTQSQFLSASNRAFGAPSIGGEPLLLDVARIQKAGGRIYSVSDVVRDLERFVADHPASRPRVEKLISTIRDIEGEVLIQGETPRGSARPASPAHSNYIRSAEELWAEFRGNRLTKAQLQQELANLEKAYARARIVGRVGRVLTVIGVVVTLADLAGATQRSVQQESFRPLGAEVIRQVGGWGAAAAGAKIGFVTGALFGIETGPGAIITGAVGAIFFGAAGYFGADWIADHISPN
jgi:LysM repeat protein